MHIKLIFCTKLFLKKEAQNNQEKGFCWKRESEFRGWISGSEEKLNLSKSVTLRSTLAPFHWIGTVPT